ncbi:MAG: hypothetical protein AB1413_05220 [Thermodesulfobacteriota bacterium]
MTWPPKETFWVHSAAVALFFTVSALVATSLLRA